MEVPLIANFNHNYYMFCPKKKLSVQNPITRIQLIVMRLK